MISYKDAEKMVGPKPEIPTKQIEYLAYKGKEITSFDTFAKAKEYSKLVDTFVVNQQEVDDAHQAVQEWGTDVFEYWFRCLQQEYDYLPEEVFKLCYFQAWERGHSAGYDEVSNYMLDVVVFAESIIAAVKKV